MAMLHRQPPEGNPMPKDPRDHDVIERTRLSAIERIHQQEIERLHVAIAEDEIERANAKFAIDELCAKHGSFFVQECVRESAKRLGHEL